MTNVSLARSYLIKTQKRLKVLVMLLNEEAYSDVIRKSQEIVELALKGMLRQVGIEPPKWHDVGSLIVEHKERFPSEVASSAQELSAISKWLRKERELCFYGDIDFIPTEEYSLEDAQRAMHGAQFAVEKATVVIRNDR